MSFKTEESGKSMVKFTIEVSPEELEKALEKAYHKMKNKINVQGFRKGKAPRAIIEKLYGAEVFYEEAANGLIPGAYEEAAKESGLEISSRPDVDIVTIKKGEPFVFTAEVAVKPEVKLGQYKGVEVEKFDTSITDEEVEEDLNRQLEQNSRTINVEDRPVADGDIIKLDYEGFCDGVAFAGGKGENQTLTIGSHSFIDTFEDQIIGHSIGDEFDVNVTFPEEYHAEELKGKPATFKVKVNEITVKELPAADDDFAKDVSEFDTIDELKADIRAKLEEKKAKAARNQKEDAVVDKIIETSEIEIPAPMLDYQKEQLADEMAQRMQMQGLTLEMYLKYTGTTPQQFMEQLTPQAEKRIKYRLVLEAIAKAEKLEATDEELQQELEDMAKQYSMELDKLKELMGEGEEKMIREDLAVKKAIDLVTEASVEK